MSRSIVVLKMSRRIKNVITFAQSIANAITDNASFPSPTPALATFQADVAALSAAETAVLARTKGAAEVRNAKLAIVRDDLATLRTYVQGVANAAVPSNAEAIIASAGMTVRNVTLRGKAALAVSQGPISGAVHLSAKSAAKKAAYSWQYSTDQKTWTQLPQTLQANTDVSGLTAATTYFFRAQALTTTGEGDWGQVVSFLVK